MDKSNRNSFLIRCLFLTLKMLLFFSTFWPIKALLIEIDEFNFTSVQKAMYLLQIIIYFLYIIIYVFSFFKFIRIYRQIIKTIDKFFILIGIGLFIKYTILANINIGEAGFIFLFYPFIFLIIFYGIISFPINKRCLKGDAE